jgi:hypothetical protein
MVFYMSSHEIIMDEASIFNLHTYMLPFSNIRVDIPREIGAGELYGGKAYHEEVYIEIFVKKWEAPFYTKI